MVLNGILWNFKNQESIKLQTQKRKLGCPEPSREHQKAQLKKMPFSGIRLEQGEECARGRPGKNCKRGSASRKGMEWNEWVDCRQKGMNRHDMIFFKFKRWCSSLNALFFYLMFSGGSHCHHLNFRIYAESPWWRYMFTLFIRRCGWRDSRNPDSSWRQLHVHSL